MPRATRNSSNAFDFSIVGDEVEQNRIQLENNLQQTDLSLHLSSLPGDDFEQDDPSVEYARHVSGPTHADFPSIGFSAGDHDDPDSFHHTNAWSYGTFDEDGVRPFAGETISTTAHHASALTLSAGLAGRVTANVSETEYDPDRPVERMIAPKDGSKDDIRSKSPRALTGSAKLDRFLQSGHTFPAAPSHKSSQISSNTPERDRSFRPKLSDAIRQVSFSPKRPRNSPSRQSRVDSHLAKPPALRPSNKSRSNPAVPLKGPRTHGHTQLPDVTGLTSAIESPAKLSRHHNQYQNEENIRESDACLFSTLNAVQSKLSHLQAENAISRRRVRELEAELQGCKQQVEKARILSAPECHERITTDGRDMEMIRDLEIEDRALEDLIVTLRTHLTRLTRELSSHHQVLTELRSQREAEGRALKSKFRQVDHLSRQVERLEGEVIVLRGMVEEGLRERQSQRQRSYSQESTGDEPPVEKDGSRSITMPRTPLQRSQSRLEVRTSPPYSPDAKSHGPAIVEEGSRERLSRHQTANSREFMENEPPAEDDEPRSIVIPHTPVLSEQEVPPLLEVRTLPSPERKSHNPVVIKTSSGPCDENFSARSARQHSQSPKPTSARPNLPLMPFPQIRGTRLERLFFSAPEHCPSACKLCRQPCRSPASRVDLKHDTSNSRSVHDEDEGFVEGSCESLDHVGEDSVMASKETQHKHNITKHSGGVGDSRLTRLVSRQVLTGIVRELEDDFTHYKSIYIELADEYKHMDAASDPPRRNILARHLREVIGLLEQRGNQIASLHDVLKR